MSKQSTFLSQCFICFHLMCLWLTTEKFKVPGQNSDHHLSAVKRFCVFEHSVMTNFSCACPAIQNGQGSGFLSENSSWLTAYMSEQRRFWRDCTDAAISTKFAWRGPYDISNMKAKNVTEGLQQYLHSKNLLILFEISFWLSLKKLD